MKKGWSRSYFALVGVWPEALGVGGKEGRAGVRTLEHLQKQYNQAGEEKKLVGAIADWGRTSKHGSEIGA